MAVTKTQRDTRRTGKRPLAYMGVEPVSPPNLTTDTRAPTPQDYSNFYVGDMWIDRNQAPDEDVWMLVNKDANVARWIMVSGGALESLTGDNTGVTVYGDANENINVTGGDNINSVGTAGTNTIAINLNETIYWPNSNAAGTAGVIYFGSLPIFHNYSANPVFKGSLFLGRNAGNFTQTGTVDHNTAIGNGSMPNITTAASNTALGDATLFNLTTGSSNIAIGDDCTVNLTTGSFNICIGSDTVPGTGVSTARNYTSSESSNIVFQNFGVTGDDNTIRLGTHGSGNSQQDRCFVAGVRGITTGVADAVPVLIDSAYQLGTVSSSLRYKDNVKDMGDDSSAVLDLRPVTFEFKSHPGCKQYGLVAEEVEEAMPRLVVRDAEGLPEAVKYHDLPAILLNEIKKLTKRVEELEKLLKAW